MKSTTVRSTFCHTGGVCMCTAGDRAMRMSPFSTPRSKAGTFYLPPSDGCQTLPGGINRNTSQQFQLSLLGRKLQSSAEDATRCICRSYISSYFLHYYFLHYVMFLFSPFSFFLGLQCLHFCMPLLTFTAPTVS